MNRNRFIKPAVLFLISASLFLSYTACSKEPESTVALNDVYLDDVPRDLNYSGETVKIEYWDNDFVSTELTADGTSLELIHESIEKRNRSVEERLGVNLEFIKGEDAPEHFMPRVKEDILAGTYNSDIIAGVQCQTTDLCISGCYLNLSDAKYLDISKNYWNSDYINEMRIGQDRLYMLGGDISLTTTAWVATMLLDLQLYNQIHGDHTPFFDEVLDGNWTLDMMFEISRKSYADLNGNNQRDFNDQFGLGIRAYSSVIDMFCFSSGVQYSTRDENNVPMLDIVNERSVSFCEKFCDAIASNDGIWCYDSAKIFEEGMTALFIATDLDTLRDPYYQEQMAVLPYPKLDSDIDRYYSWLSDNTIVYSVPVTLPEERENMVSAVLEVMASETRRLCLPVYYETAIGDKYTRDEWSRTMLDIIHDGATSDFVSIYSSSLNHVGGFMRQQVSYNNTDLAANFNAIYYNISNKFARLINTYDKNTIRKIVPESTSEEGVEVPSGEDGYEPVNEISDDWNVFGVKYRNSGILLPKDLSPSFSYEITDDGYIQVRSPSVKHESGAFPTSVIQSKNKIPLDDLSLDFRTDDGFSYSNVGYSASFSFVWTTKEITNMPQYTDQIGTNGLRESIPARDGAYALSVVFMGTKDTSGHVSNLMYIILNDGTATAPEEDNRVGYRWTNYVDTDLSEGVNISVKRDDELGYVVVLNGVEYRSGMRGNVEIPIDLSPLLDQSEGYICMGAGVTGADEYANFTWETINGKPAADYYE